MDKLPMTPEGYLQLKQKLEQLQKEMSHVSFRIKEAADLGDRSENADYQVARENKRELDQKIKKISRALGNNSGVNYLNPRDPSKIRFGSTIKIQDHQKENTIALVGEWEANGENFISILSPLGSALLGKSAGDTIAYKTPDGIKKIKVIKIEYLPLKIQINI